jgi:DNA-binding CsgD family transcriptional regulator
MNMTMNSLNQTASKPQVSNNNLFCEEVSNRPKPSTFVREVMEGFIDGILILTEQGEVLYANNCAQNLCKKLGHFSGQPHLEKPILSQVPAPIWRICEALIDGRETFPDYLLDLEDEVVIGQTHLRIRARWMTLPDRSQPCLAVTLEDRQQSLINTVMAEARKYGLTSREAEVWLLRRANHTYKAIASELHIALDTVKKHVKSINAKREAFQWARE